MNSMQKMVQRDIERYTKVGMSIDGAAHQAKAIRRGNWDTVVDSVAKQMKAGREDG